MFSVKPTNRARLMEIVRNGKALAYRNMVEAGLMTPDAARQALTALLADGPSERAEEALLELAPERPQ